MKQLLGFAAGCLLLAVLAVLLVPIAVLWCGVLLAADLFARARTEPPVAPPPRRTDAASIMILNWNGRAFLEQLLPSVRTAVAQHGGDHEIIVIDNGSEDDSVAYLRREFPEVAIVQHPANLKFVRGYNRAWDAASRDIVVLLNNDMVVDPGFLGPLLDGFADPRTFAVSSQIFLAGGSAPRVETGLTGGALRCGVLKLWHDAVPEHLTDPIPVLWAGGGSAAFDRRRLLELGGFDPVYDPFYFEDTGLSYEAWKRGDHVLFAPTSKVVHAHQGSSRRVDPNYVATIRRRNQHLFAWRHFTATGATVAGSLLLPLNVPRLAFGNHGRSLWHRAVLEARALVALLPRLPRVLGARVRNGRHARRTDAEVFDLAHSRHRFANRFAKRTAKRTATETATRPANRSRPRSPVAAPRLDILMLAGRVPKHGVDGSWGLFELMRILGQRHRVTACVLMDSAADAAHIEALRPLVHRLEAWPIERAVGEFDLHCRVPEPLRNHYSAAPLRRRLAVLLRTERFDIVQVDYLEIAALVRTFIHDLRSVHVVHEPWFRAIELEQTGGLFPSLRQWLRYVRAVNFEARLYAKFRVLSCFTAEDAAQLARYNPTARIEINPMGPNLGRITPCAPSAGTTILSVGYFLHLPNVDATLWFVRHVFPFVREAIPECELRLAGGGATDAIVALQEIPGVAVLGPVDDLDAEMAKCALTLAPIREGGGLRTKVLESFAYGRTTVATPLAVAGIHVTDGVECRIAAEPRAFADAVVATLRDDRQRHAMERAARQLLVDHFDSEQMAARSEALYRELLDEDAEEAEA